jgi:hypothetical protein
MPVLRKMIAERRSTLPTEWREGRKINLQE